MSKAVRVSEALAEWLGKALTKHEATVPDINWDLSLSIMPDEQGNAMAVYTIVVSIPGAVLGTRQMVLGQIPFDANHTYDGIEQVAGQMLEHLLAERSRLLSQNGGPVSPLNGNGRLVLPGS